MNIGFLDRRITIEAPSASPTLNAYGEAAQADAWETFVTVWAAMDNKAARSSIIADQEPQLIALPGACVRQAILVRSQQSTA